MKQHSEAMGLGGLTGQGFRNLLGRPRLVPVELLLREAVQNSWDARKRKDGGAIRFAIRVRSLDRDQEREFRAIFSQAQALEPEADNSLARQLVASKPIRVVELCDFGTVGLCGECRPSEPTGGIPSRFGNFFFEIGRAHEDSGDGGTYGFGRSSLYIVGKAALVIVDSLALEGEAPERRMMACRIGESFEVAGGRARGRYTGRHFWGRKSEQIPQPLTGKDAGDLATKLGMPTREGTGKTGTTIMIPWPVDGVDDIPAIQEALLHSLWPKMVESEGRKPVTFELECDGSRIDVSDPAAHPEYALFVKALQEARRRDHGPLARVISTLKPKRKTGHLGMAVTLSDVVPALPVDTVSGDDDVPRIEHPINSVALMRPTELVVRYMRIAGADQSGRMWAGVFICDDSDEVRTAFAYAEPPAHDDWIVERVSDKTQKYLVRKTLQTQLPEGVADILGIVPPGKLSESGSRLSLGSAAERFSRMFLAGDGQGPGVESLGGEGVSRDQGGSGLRRTTRLSPPAAIGIELNRQKRVARFRTTVSGAVGRSVRITATPSVHADGRLDELPVGLEPPTIHSWEGGRVQDQYCIVEMTKPRQEVDVLIALGGEYAVTVAVEVVAEAE